MNSASKEDLLSLLKNAYQHGVFGNFDLCEEICLDILNNFMNSKMNATEHKSSINIDFSSKTDWQTDFSNLLNSNSILEHWPNLVFTNTTTSTSL